MCIFAGPSDALHAVSGTAIFAGERPSGQVLVYRMSVAAAEPVAMVLPLPVPPNSPEDAVRFIDLSAYEEFFSDVERAFPQQISGSAVFGILPESMARSRTLPVHTVGSFEASFVPSRADFERLDRRFWLDPSIWDALPQYADWGFAVFQLRDVTPPPQGFWARLFRRKPSVVSHPIHPMAFEFPRREGVPLFFPTVHVHNGKVWESANFDHTLYAQLGRDREPAEPGWERSERVLSATVDGRAQGLVEPDVYGYRRRILGMAPNEDTLLPG